MWRLIFVYIAIIVTIFLYIGYQTLVKQGVDLTLASNKTETDRQITVTNLTLQNQEQNEKLDKILDFLNITVEIQK